MYKIVHMSIRVMDLEKSLKFYKEALCFEETKRSDFPQHEFTLVFLSDEYKTFELELTYNYNPEKPYVIGDGFSHLAVVVDDLEASHKRHADMGYEVTDLTGLPGSPPGYYFVKDPDGYQIEVIKSK